ncbi:MAG: UDP-3-O-acyl-N-acetylglucosamine deacetylase, partial [Bdellovibrio sp.]|nr:UDP-3-O-acyl-N-acetylglucosamine deacetylase [Bdellovibrio sp.]
MTLQRTIKKHVTLSGIGVHTGRVINLRIKPHTPNKGIVFRRIDLTHTPEVPAKYSYVVNTQFATTLGIGKVTISTVEHLLAAMHGLGIDNAIIELDGPEIPILDGSAYEFCKVLLTAGVEIQSDLRQELILKRPIELKIAEKWACAWPSPRFIIDASVEWDHQMIGYQSFKY